MGAGMGWDWGRDGTGDGMVLRIDWMGSGMGPACMRACVRACVRVCVCVCVMGWDGMGWDGMGWDGI